MSIIVGRFLLVDIGALRIPEFRIATTKKGIKVQVPCQKREGREARRSAQSVLLSNTYLNYIQVNLWERKPRQFFATPLENSVPLIDLLNGTK